MPRPISWLPRLHAIRQSVAGSVRSHYQRRHLERLFEVQQRSAQLLMDAMPTIGIGRSRLVERDALVALLESVQKADDPSVVLEQSRARQLAPSGRSLRKLVPHDRTPASWETLPASLNLAPGQVLICFTRLEVLAAGLVALASLLDQHLEEFAARYEPCHNLPDPEDSESLQAMFSELEAAEANRSANPRSGGKPSAA